MDASLSEANDDDDDATFASGVAAVTPAAPLRLAYPLAAFVFAPVGVRLLADELAPRPP